MPEDHPNPFLSIVSPCYKDEGNLPELHRRLTKVCVDLGKTYELVFVDDGSPDATWPTIQKLAQNDPHVHGLLLSKNCGHQIAVSAGLKHARGQRILIIDSDLEDPPELLPKMMRLMDEGADNVYGVRLSRIGVPAWKKTCYKLFYRLLNFLAGCKIPPDAGDFRLISRRLVDLVNEMPEQHRFLRGMISWVGFNQVPITYHRDARFAGESGYTLSKLFLFAVDGITSFSIKPLRIATILGALTALLAFVVAAYIVFGTFVTGRDAPGWASLMVTVLMVGSLQLFVLGIIGEYLGRLFIENKSRPLFIVAETTENKL